MARKTVEVEQIKEAANTFLAAPDSFSVDGLDTRSQRLGTAALLENVLHRTGNYKGFTYLATELVGDGSGLKPDYDDSRRKYI